MIYSDGNGFEPSSDGNDFEPIYSDGNVFEPISDGNVFESINYLRSNFWTSRSNNSILFYIFF